MDKSEQPSKMGDRTSPLKVIMVGVPDEDGEMIYYEVKKSDLINVDNMEAHK